MLFRLMIQVRKTDYKKKKKKKKNGEIDKFDKLTSENFAVRLAQ